MVMGEGVCWVHEAAAVLGGNVRVRPCFAFSHIESDSGGIGQMHYTFRCWWREAAAVLRDGLQLGVA
jgi:hypothetical protein